MVTHNMQQALDLGNRLIMMDKGQIILEVGEEQARTNNSRINGRIPTHSRRENELRPCIIRIIARRSHIDVGVFFCVCRYDWESGR